jgi:hypothetical protein
MCAVSPVKAVQAGLEVRFKCASACSCERQKLWWCDTGESIKFVDIQNIDSNPNLRHFLCRLARHWSGDVSPSFFFRLLRVGPDLHSGRKPILGAKSFFRAGQWKVSATSIVAFSRTPKLRGLRYFPSSHAIFPTRNKRQDGQCLITKLTQPWP